MGWGKSRNEPVETVFGEFIGLNGWERYYYDAVNDEWVGTPTTEPPSSKEYKVTWADASPDDQVQLVYDNGRSLNASVTWAADGWEVLGEVQTYEYVSGGVDKGDHSPGHITNKIHADYIKVYGVNGQGWQDPPSYNPVDQGNMDIDGNGYGTGFRVWDVRCYE